MSSAAMLAEPVGSGGSRSQKRTAGPSSQTAQPAPSSSSSGTGGGKIHNTAALASAYQELGKELSSSRLKSVGNYTLGRPIGEGTFGKVRLGYHRLIPNSRVAIKQIPKVHSSSLTREIHHHRRLHHPHVMQLYEVIATESYMWMVSELCAGGELYDYLVEKGCLSEQEGRRVFGQLCLAVAYVHDKGIVHRDIKLENVLLDERCNVKLGDFGFTREYEEQRLMDTFCGTTGYAAPEMLAGKKYIGKPVDVWSLGVILYALLCGTLPFDDDDEHVMKEKILKGDFDLPSHLSEEATSLISSILVKTPSARPTIPQILRHPWFSIVMPPTSPGAMSTVQEDSTASGPNQPDEEPASQDYFNQPARMTRQSSAPSPTTRMDDEAKSGTAAKLLAAPTTSTFTDASSSVLSSSAKSSSDQNSAISATSTSPTTFEEADGDSESAGASIDGADDEESFSGAADKRRAKKLPTPPVSPMLPSHAAAASTSGFLHNRNDSQTTLRKQSSAGSDASAGATSARRALPSATSKAAPPLPTHLEGETSSPEMNDGAADFDSDAAIVERNTIHIPPPPPKRNSSQNSSKGHTTGHHRTPSRSKRRSVSSIVLSDHHAPHLDSKPIDYLALLALLQPSLFSTSTEQTLLASLSALGLDVGQVVHSVMNDACDSSGALWWLLKKRADEKQALLGQLAQFNTATSGPPLSPGVSPSLVATTPNRADSAGSANSAIPPLAGEAGVSSVPGAPPLPPKDAEALDSSAPSLFAKKHRKEYSFTGVPPYPSKGKENDADYGQPVRPVQRRRPVTTQPPPTVEGTTPTGVRPGAGSDQRTRSTSFSMRQLTSVLAGMSKEKLVDDEPSSALAERSKSPVAALFGKRGVTPSGRRGSKDDSPLGTPVRGDGTPAASTPARETPDPLASSSVLSGVVGDAALPARKARNQDIPNSTSYSSLSTVASSTMASQTESAKTKFGRSRFMTTVRTWLGTEDKPEDQGEGVLNKAAKQKRKAKKGQNASVPLSISASSVRKRASPYSQASIRGRQSIPHSPLRANVSRMSSSNSVYTRPPNLRRQSGSTIHAHDGLGIQVRQSSRPSSRPSSIHSGHRIRPHGLHGKMGSASSSGSKREITGSLRHRRRASSEGGTIVHRHRILTSSAKHSRRPSKADSSEFHGAVDGEDTSVSENHGAPASNRQSTDSRGDEDEVHGASHASQSSGPYKTQFLAHKLRTSFRPPSSNSSFHRSVHRAGEPPEGQPRVATWMRSWGKPPPHWTGAVDDEPSKSEILAALKPKLRDVFAQTDEDDEWEDEDEEPNYLGGLGQPASGSALSGWTYVTGPGSRVKDDSPYSSRVLAGGSIHGVEETRSRSIRNLFQPPSLGSEFSPRIISTTSPVPAPSADGLPKNQGEAPGGTLAALSAPAGSRVRATAPPTSKLNTMQEEEEED